MPQQCPFSEKQLPVSTSWQCLEKKCRFNVGDRCAITDAHFKTIMIEKKLDAVIKALNIDIKL